MPGLLDALSGGLGYAGDVLEKFGSREAKGLLGGRPRELLSAIPFSDSLGITDPKDRVSGSDLATKWGLARSDDPFGQMATGFGIDVATDPLTWLGGAGLGRHALRGGAHVAEEASRFGKLKALREPTSMVKDLGGPGERVVGGVTKRAMYPDRSLVDYMRQAADTASGGLPEGTRFGGATIPPWNLGGEGMGFTRDPSAAGHEAMHGMVQNAALHGGEGSLPLLGRQAAREYRASGFSNKGWEAGLGSILDELNSAGIDARKTAGYGRGALEAALSPEFHRNYHNQFSAASPAIAGLFHAAPGAVPGAVLGAGAGGVAGYQQDGGEGALLGALAGGLGGAAVGGGLSHASLAPRGVTKGLAGAGGLSAAFDAPLDVAAKDAFEKVKHLIPGEGTPSARKMAMHGEFADAVDAMGLPKDVEKRVYDAKHRLETFGDPWAGEDKQLARGMMDHYGTDWSGFTASFGLKHDPPTTEEGLRNLLGPERHARARSAYTIDQALEQFRPTPGQFGLARSDPEWVNNRTFYHGTGTAGLSPQVLDIAKTDPMALVGRGIYTTDEAGKPTMGITKGYGEARAMDLETQLRRTAAGAGTEKAREAIFRMSRRRPALLERLLADDELYKATRPGPDDMFSFNPPGAGPEIPGGELSDLLQRLEEKHQERLLGNVVRPDPTIYQAQSDFGRILDLDQPNAELARALASHPRWDFQLAPGDETNPIYDVFQNVRSGGPEESDALTEYLKQQHGYDALTHTGGGRWGGASEDPHQVVVGLDPRKYRRFEPLPGDELARIFGGGTRR